MLELVHETDLFQSKLSSKGYTIELTVRKISTGRGIEPRTCAKYAVAPTTEPSLSTSGHMTAFSLRGVDLSIGLP